MSNYDELKELVARISGQASVVTILRVYLDIFDDLELAAVISQCVFWSDKGRTGDGWFYKSQREWQAEIGIKRSALQTAIKKLSDVGIVETRLDGGRHNSPTTYYRVNMDNLTHVITEHLKIRLVEINKSNARSVEINESDMLKSTNRPVEINESSYSSLHSSLRQSPAGDAASEPPADSNGLTNPIWTKALGYLRKSFNGTYAAINPTLVAIDENPHKFTVLVGQQQPGLKKTVETAVASAVKDLKLRRTVHVTIVTDWPGTTPARRVSEYRAPAGSKAQAALADLLNEA